MCGGVSENQAPVTDFFVMSFSSFFCNCLKNSPLLIFKQHYLTVKIIIFLNNSLACTKSLSPKCLSVTLEHQICNLSHNPFITDLFQFLFLCSFLDSFSFPQERFCGREFFSPTNFQLPSSTKDCILVSIL